MKAVILAGGFGTRLSEETVLRPKPMVEVGGHPILWHIMKIYARYGVNEFIIALGYKGEMIKDYFLDYYAHKSNITVDLESGTTEIHNGNHDNWKVHLVDTGLNTQTGGRLRRLRPWLDEGEIFHFTYGDGVADIDLDQLVAFHRDHGKKATVTAVRFPARFGRMTFEGERIAKFYEKPHAAEGWISGGFFVLHTDAIDYIDGDETIWEHEPVEGMVANEQLMGYRHDGFWSCMDTLREKQMLEELWGTGAAPWKIWDCGTK